MTRKHAKNAGGYMREQRIWRAAYRVECPKCGAQPGEHCRTLGASDAAIVHGPRVDASREMAEK